MSQEMKQLVENKIAEVLKHNIIEPSTKKKDGSYRMAADFKMLNSKYKPLTQS